MKLALTVFIACLFTAKLTAQVEDIAADRPDQTETPSLVPVKHFQMETGFVYESAGDEKTITHPSLLLKYGLFEHVELRLIFESQTVQRKFSGEREFSSGVVPLEIGLKVKLFGEKKARPSAALIGHIGIPWAGSEKFRTKYFPFNFRFTLQHTLKEWLSLGYNAGVEWDGESAEPTFVYTLVTGFSITEKFGTFIEVYGFIPQKSLTEHFADAGFTYLIKPNVMLDISGGWQIAERAWFAGCGLSFRVPD